MEKGFLMLPIVPKRQTGLSIEVDGGERDSDVAQPFLLQLLVNSHNHLHNLMLSIVPKR